MLQSDLTVTSPAGSYDLTVLDTVKRELGITNTDSDALLTDHIRQVSNAIMSWTRRVFASEGVTETFWPDCGWVSVSDIVLERYPVSTLTSVTLDGVELDSSLYRLRAQPGQVLALDASGSPSRFCFGKSAVVVYTAGYDLLDGLPFDIERAAILWVSEAFNAAGRDPRLKSEQNYNVASFSYFDRATTAGDPPPDVMALLSPYRRMIV